MELRVKENGQLSLGSAYKMIATGWMFGVGGFFAMMFIPMFIIFLIMALSGQPMSVNGEMTTGWAAFSPMLIMLVMMPVVIAFHAVMFGGMIVLGLVAYRQFRPITVKFPAGSGGQSSSGSNPQ
ncbi:MAG: hypothetical protein DHS20C06_17760 [Hyphobacterium sp.]|nr:MAG: hypothetical protein DHS20C06_17760 [Hyphobacterium sp.]